MNLNELQKESKEIIDRIDEKLSTKHTDENTIIHLTEELGEIARQINNKNIRHAEQDKDNLAEEIADVIILTSQIANNNGINIDLAILNKINKLKQRHNL